MSDIRSSNYRYSMEFEGRAKQILLEKGFTILAEAGFARSSTCYDIIAQKDGIKYAVNVKGTRTGTYGITSRNVKGLQQIPDCVAAFMFLEGTKSIGFFVCSNDTKTKQLSAQEASILELEEQG